jgi:nucleoside-diphosphate-sugar epimerase
MQVAILGASSQISKGLIKLFVKNNDNHLFLFVRDEIIFKQWIESQDPNNKNFEIHQIKDFNSNFDIDLIINCVGVGDPNKVMQMGSNILDITKIYDDIVLDYLHENPRAKYIFLSSGAVYGDIFSAPADEDSKSLINLNFDTPANFYSLAKLYAEARHRALPNLNIADVRVFNYISPSIDLNGNFFIAQAIKASIDGKIFQTNSTNINRDFVGPEDLFSLISAINNFPQLNDSFDCFSKKPIDKFKILDFLQSNFNLEFIVHNNEVSDFIKDSKENYYSVNYKAKAIGFEPEFESIENINNSILAIIDKN